MLASRLDRFGEFIEPVGRFALAFPMLEREVSWAVESSLSLSRKDGNEFEGMVQSFAARIKLLDLCTRSLAGSIESDERREQIILDLKSLYRMRNTLFHNSTIGFGQDAAGTFLMVKKLDGETGKEKMLKVYRSTLTDALDKIDDVVRQIRKFVLDHFPQAENRVP